MNQNSLRWEPKVFRTNCNGFITAEDHARLLGNLHKPFTIASGNSRRHLELLKYKDLLLDDNRYLQNELDGWHGLKIVGAEFGLKGLCGVRGTVYIIQG